MKKRHLCQKSSQSDKAFVRNREKEHIDKAGRLT